ncbi:hypothetical protein CBS101457_003514 [Exobasidium rhododendri]|nr:hypothetical protein CBS101457_003514 [Exobasidium rhododendri]
MVLEATMVVIDNSEWMRNGDYLPTRWDAQSDAVNIVFDAKTSSNPESRVGLITMAGKRAELLASLTQDMGKMIGALHGSKLGGQSDISNGINIAQLALKHRENKSLRQRILVFVGSPVPDEEADLVRLGKKLKKNNVAVDVVNFGETEENLAKLLAFIESVNSGENSHLVTVESGAQLLSDSIISSPILMDSDGAGPSGSGSGGGGGNYEFGVDPSMDPELAMALRMSLEEEQARQRAAEGTSASAASEVPSVAEANASDETSMAGETTTTRRAAAAAAEAEATAPTGTTVPSSLVAPSTGSLVLPGADAITGSGLAATDESEEAMLQQAIALSQGGNTNQATGGRDEDVEMGEGEEGEDDMDEEEAIARAIEMSLKGEQDAPSKK